MADARLAVGARNADPDHLEGGLTVKRRRNKAQPPTQFRHRQRRHRQYRRRFPRLIEDGGRTGRRRFFRPRQTVRLRAFQRHEDIPGLHGPRIQRDFRARFCAGFKPRDRFLNRALSLSHFEFPSQKYQCRSRRADHPDAHRSSAALPRPLR